MFWSGLPRDFSGTPAAGVRRALETVAAVDCVFVLGYAWFYKLRKSFADMI